VQHPIRHLHHVTATVAEARPDLNFCRGLLGLRLVKRTVNFDNHGVYHFYYGTEQGAPGTIWTTFPYAGQRVLPGVHGAGQVVATAFSVPAASLGAWRGRVAAAGVALELVADGRDVRPAWQGGGVEADLAVRGLHSVTLMLRDRAPTIALLTGVLGFTIVNEGPDRTRLAVGGDRPGHLVDLVVSDAAPAARNGLGTVHHVAFAIEGADEQVRLRGELVGLGLDVTPVRDRTYFQSIYFREPGGVLFEVATTAPGFTFDEPLDALGTALKLPPWEEPSRAAIEAALPPLGDAG
jgi:glyoxalase family protein